MKNVRYNNEVFRINELIVNEIFSLYNNLNLNLPLNFLDIRPFFGLIMEKLIRKNIKLPHVIPQLLILNQKVKMKYLMKLMM